MRLALFVALFAVCAVVHAQTPSSQISALNALYTSLNGPNWAYNQGWTVGDPCTNHWYGVSCTSNSVTGLYLASNKLDGTIPSSISSLVDLVNIVFGSNKISGYIPSSFFSLDSLQTVDLSNNELTGSLSQLGQASFASTITSFNVSLNQLSGSFPSLSFSKLTVLDIHSNKFSSPPSSLSSLSSLATLDMSSNSFYGYLPTFPTSSLTSLNVSHNLFYGTLPSFSSTNLRTIDLSFNSLYDDFPSALATSATVKTLDLSNNQLYGSVPQIYNAYSYSPLTYLDLSHNDFSSYAPSISTTNLAYLDLSFNRFVYSIPSSYFSLSYLEYLDLSSNQFSSLSYSLSSLTNLKYLNLSHNEIYTSLPYLSSNSALEVIDFSDNSFYSSLPYSINYNLRYADFSDNQLGGSVPSCFFSSSQLEVFKARNTGLYGYIPGSAVYPNKLTVVDLSDNYLDSSIPSTLGSFDLKFLHLQNNQLTGSLPSFLQYRPSDLDFDASNNLFDCPLPSWCDENTGDGSCFPCQSDIPWWMIGGITFGVVFIVITIVVVVVAFIVHRRKKAVFDQNVLAYGTIAQDPNFAPTYPSDGSFKGIYEPTPVFIPAEGYNNGTIVYPQTTTYN